MSAAPERREPIDIDEFERRLRGPEPARRLDDPMAELARLLGEQQASDPVADLFAANPRPGGAPPVMLTPASPVAPAVPPSDPFAGFPDLRPLLRGGVAKPAPAPAFPEAVETAPLAALDVYPENPTPSAEYEDWAGAPELSPEAPALEAPRARSKKPLYIAAAVIAVGFVAIGSTLAWRGGAHQAGGVATIAASTSPTKIQPKEGEGGEKTARESTMLERTQAPPVKKVTARDEQPMDVSAAAKTPRVIPLEEATGATPAAGGGAGAASGPAVAPPSPPVREPAQARSAFPEPKRVKTVSVRADGSIIGGAENAAPSSAAAPKAPERAAPAANATPKSATRADATTSAALSKPAASKPAAPKPVAPKPKVEAKAEPKAEPKLTPKPRVAAVEPKEEAQGAAAEATDEDETPKAASSGAYAVQVASAGSESEARQTAARLADKLSGALGGRRPAVIKASDSLYRIRVTGLSKESASSMCGKVKAAGGACFVAR